MAKKAAIGGFRAIVALLCLSSVLTGCGTPLKKARLAEVADILAGVIAWARQDFPASTTHFLDSLTRSETEPDSSFSDYALYGLGSTYLAGDEREAAGDRFDSIGPDAPVEIIASVWYQRGIIAYRDGDYDAAAKAFRRSIETGGAAPDARVNMELSLRSRDESRSRSSAGPTAVRTEPATDPAANSIFNLIRKKEQDRWKNQESDSAESTRVDY